MAPERFPRELTKRIEGTDFPLNALSAVRDLRKYLDHVEDSALLKAREMGASASLMADALGVTRQGIYHKLKVLEEGMAGRTEDAAEEAIVIPELEPKQE